MLSCKEVDCCTNVNLPTIMDVHTLAHWLWSPLDKFSVAAMCSPNTRSDVLTTEPPGL